MTRRITDERFANSLQIIQNLCSWLDQKAQECEDISFHHEAETVSEIYEALQAEREHTNRECIWTEDDPDYGVWEADCGIEWSFHDDGPVENGCNYCPGCGGKVALNDQPPDELPGEDLYNLKQDRP